MQYNGPDKLSRVGFKFFASTEIWHKFDFEAPRKIFNVENQLILTKLNPNLVTNAI